MKSYKILLVCSGGMSTSVLMNKMQKYGEENGIDMKVDACGTNKYEDEAAKYDIILLGPRLHTERHRFRKLLGFRSFPSSRRTMHSAMLPISSRGSMRFWGQIAS